MDRPLLWLFPFALQGLAMGVDEFHHHRRRSVPPWEGLGHALDTAVFLACLACPVLFPPILPYLAVYGVMGACSCLLITKDEFLHQRLCSGGEHWVHAVLFLLHPMVLMATAWVWIGPGTGLKGAPAPALARGMLRLQGMLVLGFLVYQILAWAKRKAPEAPGPGIDNSIYDELGERWHTATDDPVALLRAESRLRTTWVLSELKTGFQGRSLAILDVACGGGLLANPLAQAGHRVTGIDLSLDSLRVARLHDATHSVTYLPMDARSLAFPDEAFDGVCMMDFLEHLPERDEVIGEASRVLKPGGCFFFHTFNRTPLAGLVAIKGVEWFVKNTPRHMHVYHLFLKPRELEALCSRHGLVTEVVRGVAPRVFSRAFLRLLATGRVGDDFQFRFTPFRLIGYCGRARKAS